MNARYEQLLDRLCLIESRLDRIEDRLDEGVARAPATTFIVQPRAAALPAEAPPVLIVPPTSPLSSLVEARVNTAARTIQPPIPTPTPLPASISTSTPATGPTAPGDRPRKKLIYAQDKPQPEPLSLERIIGGRWYAVLGGLVVIIGVAFFYQYAVQQGWFKLLPAWAKCGAGTAFGACLLAAAELLRRRVNDWAAVGLSAAGIGSMYVSAYAAYARYGLVGWPTAFVLLTACAALGILFAVRARLVAVAVVSLIGGYLTPLLLHSGARPGALPGYWLMLLTVGLVLAGRLGGPFVALRWITYWGTLIFGGAWVLMNGAQYPIIAIGLLVYTWCAVHAELWWSASRCRDPDDADSPVTHDFQPPAELAYFAPLLSSFCVTVWTVGLGVIHARSWGQIPDWMPAAGGAAATGLAALVLAGNLRILRDAPRTATERLGASLTAQAAGLLIAAVALALSGRLEVSAWLAMGLAAVFAGRWMTSRAVGLYGGLLLVIATARLMTYDALFSTMPAPLFNNLGLVFSWWMLLVIAAAACWMTCARLIHRWPISATGLLDREDAVQIAQRLTAGVSGLALALLLASCVHARASALSITLVWMGLSALALACSRFIPALRLNLHSVWSAVIVLIPWSIAFVAPGWARNTDPPGMHRGLAIAAVLAAQLIFTARVFAAGLPADDDRRPAIRSAGLILATLLIFVATTFEASRAAGLLLTDRTGRMAAISIWWGLFALALLAAGFLRKTASGEVPRRAGLILLGIATAKALFIDTAQVSLGWRVISVLGLGLLMLGVGVAYARLTRRPPAPSSPSPQTDRPLPLTSQ